MNRATIAILVKRQKCNKSGTSINVDIYTCTCNVNTYHNALGVGTLHSSMNRCVSLSWWLIGSTLLIEAQTLHLCTLIFRAIRAPATILSPEFGEDARTDVIALSSSSSPILPKLCFHKLARKIPNGDVELFSRKHPTSQKCFPCKIQGTKTYQLPFWDWKLGPSSSANCAFIFVHTGVIAVLNWELSIRSFSMSCRYWSSTVSWDMSSRISCVNINEIFLESIASPSINALHRRHRTSA